MPGSDDPLLGDYLEDWLRRRRTQLRPSTFVGYRGTVRNHLRPRFGSLRLSELDRRDVEQAGQRPPRVVALPCHWAPPSAWTRSDRRVLGRHAVGVARRLVDDGERGS